MDEASRALVSRKLKSAEEVAALIGPRPRNRRVIMCHGTFDIVHPGHVRHLLYARTKADILVASLTADVHIEKSNMRPYVPEALRAINLAALEMVDYVIVDSERTPIVNIALIRPDLFAKGYEYSAEGLHPRTLEEKVAVEAYGGEYIFTPGDVVYSSSALIDLAPPRIAVEKLLSLIEAEGISFPDIRGVLSGLLGCKVHVVGDTIIDSYTACSAIGGMTKTPTMSLRFQSKSDCVGGAGIVAKHLAAAGAEVLLSTVVGDDPLGRFALDDLRAAGVQCMAVVDATRPTTNKNAIVADGYRLFKIDTLDNRTIGDGVVSEFQRQLREGDSDAVVFSDFRHGIFNRTTIPLLTAAIPDRTFRVADSQVASRWGNILEFMNFDLITPNEREARFALGDQDTVVRPLGLELYDRAGCGTLILKCSERGILTYRKADKNAMRSFFAVDSFAENVTDAVGAGDALLAYATLAMVTTRNEVIASILGSLAAAAECEHDGNRPITPAMVGGKLDALEKQARFSR